jgi:hypothetical protein
LDNDHITIAPEAARHEDMIYVLQDSVSPCILRQEPDGYWTLVSGDCPVFDSDYWDEEKRFSCNLFLSLHSDNVEYLKIR